MDRDFKGVWIPKEIWLNKDLTVMEKLFLVEIDSLDNNEGCYASNAHFSEMFDVSKGRCTQIIKSLESKGQVKITLVREGKKIVKRVVNKLNTPIKNTKQPIKNIKQPYLENAKGSNTKSNNTKEIVATAPDTTGKKKKVIYDDEDMGLAVTMFQNILAINPGTKKPDLEAWANEFRLMRQIDGREPERMDNLLNSLISGHEQMWEFWRGVILSPKSLRKSYDKIVSQYRKDVVDAKKVVDQSIPLSKRVAHLAKAKAAS